MEIKQASVLVSALLMFLAPALTQAVTEVARVMACQIAPANMFFEECNRPGSSGSDATSTRKKRGVNDAPDGFNPYNLNCPSATDQSAIYQLNEERIVLRFDEFVSEVVANPILFGCLIREIVNDDPPIAIFEEFLQESNATCPSQVQRLLTYKSARFPGFCLLLNLGDTIRLQECMGDPFCKGCKQPSKHLNRQKRCVTLYRSANFWAFCPSQPVGQRFVRDKIIVPVACNCLEIPCERVFLAR